MRSFNNGKFKWKHKQTHLSVTLLWIFPALDIPHSIGRKVGMPLKWHSSIYIIYCTIYPFLAYCEVFLLYQSWKRNIVFDCLVLAQIVWPAQLARYICHVRHVHHVPAWSGMIFSLNSTAAYLILKHLPNHTPILKVTIIKLFSHTIEQIRTIETFCYQNNFGTCLL